MPEVFSNEVYVLDTSLIYRYSQAYKIIEHDIFLKHPVLLPYLAHVRETVKRVNPHIEPVADIKSKVDALANVMWFDRFSGSSYPF